MKKFGVLFLVYLKLDGFRFFNETTLDVLPADLSAVKNVEFVDIRYGVWINERVGPDGSRGFKGGTAKDTHESLGVGGGLR